jgi:hypothetical protein
MMRHDEALENFIFHQIFFHKSLISSSMELKKIWSSEKKLLHYFYSKYYEDYSMKAKHLLQKKIPGDHVMTMKP